MTKLHILSDLHLEGRSFALPNTDADIIVLAGDIGTAKAPAIKQINAWAWNKPVIYVAGNHEFYGGEFPTQLNVLFSSLVTHHLPSTHSIAPEWVGVEANPAFCTNLEYLFPKVDMWIHGHTHTAVQY